jgi:hypothetical protein
MAVVGALSPSLFCVLALSETRSVLLCVLPGGSSRKADSPPVYAENGMSSPRLARAPVALRHTRSKFSTWILRIFQPYYANDELASLCVVIRVRGDKNASVRIDRTRVSYSATDTVCGDIGALGHGIRA